MNHNTIIIKVILSRDVNPWNYFFVHWRDQFIQLEVEITANGETTSMISKDISKSRSDTISALMTKYHNKLPFQNELTEKDSEKRFVAVISGGY